MSKQWGINDIGLWSFLFETNTAGFEDTATPIWAACVEAAEGWDWQQSVCVIDGVIVEVG